MCREMKKAKETALALAEKGMSVADIADIVKVSVKLVQEWLSGSMSLVKAVQDDLSTGGGGEKS